MSDMGYPLGMIAGGVLILLGLLTHDWQKLITGLFFVGITEIKLMNEY